MTSTVKITAHCADDTEVEVVEGIFGEDKPRKTRLLDNGVSYETHIYDNYVIGVRERKKVTP